APERHQPRRHDPRGPEDPDGAGRHGAAVHQGDRRRHATLARAGGVAVMTPDTAPLPASARKVQEALARLGRAFEVKQFGASTRTAADAAAAIGCDVAQIAKSLVFRARPSDRPVLVVASGRNRVDEAKVAAALGETLARADADFVREKTGFAIGGVPP